MKILLTSAASYDPPKGGSTRSNLAWLRELEAGGAACRVVAGEERHPAERLAREIAAFQPDWVLVSSEDVSHRLLRAAERACPGKLVYLAHTPQFFPFGPESWNCDAEAARIVGRAAGVVAIGAHMADYILQHARVRAEVIHPPIYSDSTHAGVSGEMALIINPCVVKGIEIFLALAARFPSFAFGALAGWGTTSEDRAAMARLPNVCVLERVRDIGEVLSRAKVLLMPSLWYEGFGLIAMEAMLRGLPVISSDSGGLMEAKQGTGYVIPVKPVERYEAVFDENHMPRPVGSAQDIEPWAAALQTLMTDREAYRQEAERSRAAALRFTAGVRPGRLQEYLGSLKPRVTDARRELLLKRLRR